MITHILYKLLDKFNVANGGFRKVLAVFISLMIFGLLLAVVKFTRMEIPNFNRNLAMLLGVDLSGFFFVVWKERNIKKEVSKVTEPVEIPADFKEESKNEIPIESEKQNIEIVTQIVEENKEDDDNLEQIMNEIIEENIEKEPLSEIQ